MTTTRFAIAAVATALMGSTALAADLGGNCCADLEERIAELEATTVRGGTRKVSLTISGFVAHQVMWWNDGTQKDFYIGDGGMLGSRFRFLGTAKISPQMSAGFLYEFQANTSGIQGMNQLSGGQFLGATGAPPSSTLNYQGCAPSNFTTNSSPSKTASIGCPVIRDTTVWLRHNQLGMVKVGHGSTATDNLILTDLGGAVAFTSTSADISLLNGGMILRGRNGNLATSSTVNWGAATRGHESFDTDRRSHVMYETPTLLGFVGQVAVANDNFWDIALRYSGEFSGVRLAGGVGYLVDQSFNAPYQNLNQTGGLCSGALAASAGTAFAPGFNGNCDVQVKTFTAAGSILHVDTGLFLSGSYGKRQLSGTSSGVNSAQNGAALSTAVYSGPDLTMFYLTGGLSKNYFGIGKTVISADWSRHTGGLAQASFLNVAAGYVPSSTGAFNGVGTCINGAATNGLGCSSTVTVYGVQAQQTIDAAAMTLFVGYHRHSLESDAFTGTSSTLNKTSAGGVGVADYQSFIAGTRIEF